MTHKQTMQNVRVGVFVIIALLVLTVTVFVIGQERSMFTSKMKVHTSFADINGLVVGAPVRLAGVDVGRVTKIAFSDDLRRPEARIEIAIESEFTPRLRRDSRAFIDSKGLLGDKLINLSVGSPSEPAVKSGDYITPRQGSSFESVAKELEQTAGAVGRAAQSAQGAVDRVATPEVSENVRRITASLASILEEVDRSEVMTRLEAAIGHAESASARVDRVLARVEHGPGTLHSLAYGNDAPEAIAEWKRAATGITELTNALNHGDGLVAALAHDESGQLLLRDLASFSARLDRIAKGVEHGRGTLGGLVVDPSIYEDMKTVLGNIDRSVAFKALVRMTIKEDGLERPALQARPVAPQ